jgi:thymidylate synthase (FAD)
VSFKESGTFFDKKRKNANDEQQEISLQSSCGCCCHGDIRKIDILDKGEVELLGVFGTDLTVVNAARVSFGNRKSSLSNEDIKLTGYLADNKHYSPFRHIMIRFRIKAPEFVMRQLYKHIVGIEVTASYPTKDHAWNEISGRYKPVEDFYYPTEWRKQSKNNKQASNGLIEAEGQ